MFTTARVRAAARGRENGYDEVSFTGGAPTARRDFVELVAHARELGYEYIAITDHSRSSVIANGLPAERLEMLIEEVRAANHRLAG